MPRILIAEDDPGLRDVFRATLSNAGYQVIQAADGEEALSVARAELPDLILLDFSMPRLDGLSCMRALKADEATKAIPVIAVTARGELETRIEASVAGCDGFIAKPAEPADIVKAVDALAGPR